MTKIKYFSVILFLGIITFISCKKTDYSFGDIKTPTGLTLSDSIVGQDTNHPNGDGSGTVIINANATSVLNYSINFGDGLPDTLSSTVNNLSHTYTATGTADYTITITAVGTGGSESVISKKITVFANFPIPAYIVADLTNGSSQVWQTDHDAVGHVGVGPTTTFTSDWYSATPNSRDACLYDDEITFSKNANGIQMSVDNKGQTFIIAAATAFYSQSGGDNCYSISTAAHQLNFMAASSASTAANSTRVQFVVPFNGIVNFATGGNTYEILSISSTNMTLRNIGADGNAWYQKLKVK